MPQLPLGTTKTFFNNTWSYVDPQYVKNLGLWRVYPGIPEAGDITGLGAILPIVSKSEVNSNTIKVSFNISGLEDVDATAGRAEKNKAFLLLQQPNLPGMAPAGQTVRTILPVNNVRAAEKVVLYFDIKSLQRAEIVGHGAGYVDTRPEKYKVTVKGYNNSNGVNIDSEAPMVDEVIGSTATFSFDITTLPPA